MFRTLKIYGTLNNKPFVSSSFHCRRLYYSDSDSVGQTLSTQIWRDGERKKDSRTGAGPGHCLTGLNIVKDRRPKR